MRMRKRTYILVTIPILLFIGINFFLIEKENSKIDRLLHTDLWKSVTQSDLTKTLAKEGVVTSEEETPIYFNDEFGTFAEFLVKEGDEVEVGTPLFQYEATDLEAQRNQLESDIDQLEDEIDSIEDHIDDLEDLERSVPSVSDEEEKIPLEASAMETEFSIEKEIASKEFEISRLENQIDNLERQVSDLDSYESSLTVQSSVAGIVKNLSHEIDNPLITIASATPVVNGDLTETESLEVEEKMQARIRSKNETGTLKGEISQISSFPKHDPAVEKESSYPFTVTIQDESKLLPGHHVEVSIILEEVKNVLAVPEISIEKLGDKEYIWVLTDKGTVTRKEVKTGLVVEGKQQITSGVEKGEHYIVNPSDYHYLANGVQFTTPLNWSKVELKDWKKQLKEPFVMENLLMGILERK
jgi:HlyD family secretion protein